MVRRAVPSLVALALTLAGCSAPSHDDAATTQVYTVAGEIVRLPDAGRPDGAEIYIRHAAIPDFVDSTGEVVGMESMTMGFPLSDEVPLAGLAVGDRIEFDLSVSWEGSPPVEITRVVELAPEAPGDPGDAPAGASLDAASETDGSSHTEDDHAASTAEH